MYNFTDSPFEKMMKQRPPGYREPVAAPPPDSPCRGCTIWQGMTCLACAAASKSPRQRRKRLRAKLAEVAAGQDESRPSAAPVS